MTQSKEASVMRLPCVANSLAPYQMLENHQYGSTRTPIGLAGSHGDPSDVVLTRTLVQEFLKNLEFFAWKLHNLRAECLHIGCSAFGWGAIKKIINIEALVRAVRSLNTRYEAGAVALGLSIGTARFLSNTLLSYAFHYLLKAVWEHRAQIKPRLARASLFAMKVIGKLGKPLVLLVEYVAFLFDSIYKSVFATSATTTSGGPPTTLGYFRWNAKDFYRHDDRSISRVKLLSIHANSDDPGSNVYDIEPLEDAVAADFSPGESTLRHIVSNACPSPLERGEVLVYDAAWNLFSSATVLNNILIMCRHKTKSHQKIIIKGGNVSPGAVGVTLDLSRAYRLDNHGAPLWEENDHTCTFLDFLAIPLHKDEISNVGVKSWKEKDVTRKYELQRGSITYSTDDFGTIIKEEGAIPENQTRIHNLGLSLAQIVSKPGASASPVCVVQCGTKLCGVWLGIPAHSLSKYRGTGNLFMHSDAVLANLDKLGLVKNPLLQAIQRWGSSLRDSIEASGRQLAPLPPERVHLHDAPGESREDKRSRQARMWKEYHEALERERLDEIREEDEEQDYAVDMETAARQQAAMQARMGRRQRDSAQASPSGLLTGSVTGEAACPGTPTPVSPPVSFGHARSVVQPLFRLPSRVASPLPEQFSSSPGESASASLLTIRFPKGTITRAELEGSKPSHFGCEYFDIGESVITAPPGLAEEYQPQADQRHSLDTLVKSWKYGLLHGDVPSMLKEIDIFAQLTPPDTTDPMRPAWIDQANGYVKEASQDVRERLKAVLNVESNARLRDYMQKTAPTWNRDHEDVILDRDGKPFFTKVGSYEPTRIGKTRKSKGEESKLQKDVRDLAEKYHKGHLDEAGEIVHEHGCKKGEYKIPLGTKSNIHKSLVAQAKMTTASAPNLSEKQKLDFENAVKLVRQKYSHSIDNAKIQTYLEEGEWGLLKTFQGFEDKSSGISAKYRNLKKSVYVNTHPTEVVDLALSRVILIAAAGSQLLELNAIELIDYGCCDVKDVFLKPEVHSPQKFEEERFRLIWISSLLDLTVQSLFHKADNAAHTEAYQAGVLTCAALGLGHSDDGIKQLTRAFEAEGVVENNVSCDASAFDLSLDSSFIFSDGERRSENCSDPFVSQLIFRYAHLLCSHVLNNQGDVWLVEKYGVTTSGHLSTTTQNTYSRSVQAAYGGSQGWVCAGDDLVADKNFDPKRLEDFGVRSRDIARNEHFADFTSHFIDIEAATATFGNVEKMLWNLYNSCRDVTTNRERFGGLLYILRNTPGVCDDLSALATSNKIDTVGYVNETDCIRDII
jgi:hypothetical protein